MRILGLIILGIATMTATAAARAQTYDPNFPVCLHVYGRVSYIDCSYNTLPQCLASASGRSASCQINPYFANPGTERPAPRHHRGPYQAY